MPNSNSAKKRVRQTEGRKMRNKARKTRVRTEVRKVRKAVAMGDAAAAANSFKSAEALLDRAAQKHVMHRNKANRLKSRLARKVNAVKAD